MLGTSACLQHKRQPGSIPGHPACDNMDQAYVITLGAVLAGPDLCLASTVYGVRLPSAPLHTPIF
jgi:hypothetical protein